VKQAIGALLIAALFVLASACTPPTPVAAPPPAGAVAASPAPAQTIAARPPDAALAASPKPSAQASVAPSPSPAVAAASTTEPDLQEIIQRGELRVALTGTNIPFNMIDKTGAMIGFDPDITQAIADKIGVKRTFEVSRFAGLIPNLTSGKVDLISAGMTINDERKQVVDFSDVYFHEGKVLIVNTQKHPGVTDWAVFNTPESTLAVVTGSTDETAASRFLPNAQQVHLDSYTSSGLEVQAGRVDAMLSNIAFASIYVKQNSARVYGLMDKPFSPEDYGIAMQKGKPGLTRVVNQTIAEMESSGAYKNLYDRWFVTLAWLSDVDLPAN
jgi:polar amino acid transport system substrate-binding protein